MNEQQWIQTFIHPRGDQTDPTTGPGDDAALFQAPQGSSSVISVDCLVSGQHFLYDWLLDWHPPEVLATRLLRGSLSDLSAMGATASGLLLSLECEELPGYFGESFWNTVDEELRSCSVKLLGGNVTRSSGSLALHATVVGHVVADRCWRRDRAQTGDWIGVSGRPGKAAQALAQLRKGEVLPKDDPWRSPACRQQFARQLGKKLQKPATAIDLSDGLGLDLQRVCLASHVSAEIDLTDLASARNAPTHEQIIGGGEDYELLLAIDPGDIATVDQVAEETGTPFTWIGRMTEPGSENPQPSWKSRGKEIIPETSLTGWDPFRS